MSFPRYPKYKDSGVEWLGRVPEHWSVARTGSLGVFSSSGIDKKLVDGEVPVQMFNYLDIYKSRDKVLHYAPSLMSTTAPVEKVKEHSVIKGDLLITPSSETSDDIGHVARVEEMPCAVVYSYHLIRFRLHNPQSAPYMTYAMNATSVRSYFESVCTGTTRMVLVRDDLRNAPIAAPPPSEQSAIAAFLDRETAKIDALIAEQQRLIELLQEKRQAVISHAVTKGLNPDAPMRASGVDWLGQVPVHWTVLPLRKLASLQTGYTPPPHVSGHYQEEAGFPWFRPEDLDESGKPCSATKFLSTEGREIARPVREQSTLICCIGTIGKVGYIASSGATNQQITAASFHRNPRYGFFSTQAARNEFEAEATGNVLRILNTERLGRVRFPCPPESEAEAIATYLDSVLTDMSHLTSTAECAIALLQERRSALISAAVTGQIDVRSLADATAA